MNNFRALSYSSFRLLALLAMLLSGRSVFADSNCCLTLPASPASKADAIVTVTFNGGFGFAPEYSLFDVNILPGSPMPPIPVGNYAGFCFDVTTDIEPAPGGTLYGGYLLSSCDPNLNSYLPDHPHVKQSPATWKKINYLINHRLLPCNGTIATMWEAQLAVFTLMGQDLPPSPPYPPYRPEVVQCLVDAANANADAWNLQCGDKTAVVYNIDLNWDNIAPEIQLIFLEVPYCPPINCPTNAAIDCSESLDPALNPKLEKPSTADCCPITTSYVDSITSSNCPGTYTISRTWTAATACATNICTQTITVTDNSKPTVTVVPPGGDLGCNPTVLPTDDSVKALVVATDTCGQIVTNVTHVDVTTPCSVARTFTIVAVDQCGNASDTKTVVYTWKTDLLPPVLSGLPPASTNYQCLGDVPAPPIVTALDNCDGVLTVGYNSSETGTPCNRIITRVWTVRDSCGNPASFTQTINVKDTIKPVLTVPADMIVECSAIPSVGNASATDNCDANPIVQYLGQTNLNTGCTNTLLRTWKAKDSCGNESTKTQTLTVIDKTAPILVGVPTNVTVTCGNVPSVPVVTASDNCDTNLIVPVFNEIRKDGTCVGNYSLIRTWTACDKCGNAVTNSQTINVIDTNAPIITCSSNKTVECGQAWSFNPPTASDTCSAVTVNVVSTVTNGTACNLTITRTWEAVDKCGNRSTCSQVVSVRDTTPPQIVCAPDIILSNAVNYCSYTPGGWGAPPSGCNVGTILASNFSNVYPSGYVEIGIPGSGGKSIKFTSALAIQNFLPSGGPAGALTSDLVNPTNTTSAGVFAQHVLALTLNVNFSAAGVIGTPGSPLGNLVVNNPSSPFNGMTINQILAIANIALGGGNVSSYGVTISDLATITDLFNNAFDNCDATSWAVQYLLPPSTSTTPGTPKVTDNCDSAPVLTYTDVVTQQPCGTTTNRTWKAKDACGNTATCVQVISKLQDSVCVSSTFNFNGNSALDGPDGNVRIYTTNGLSVKVTAFSRNKTTGVWSNAWLGTYSGGLGVTDDSEGGGANNSHTVDNIGRDNFVLFEFSEPVTVKNVSFGYVVTDSDFAAWYGNFADPFNNHLNLNDSILGSFLASEVNQTTLATTRTATINTNGIIGNAFVVAAWPGDSTPDDQFKISLLEVCKRSCTPPPPPCTSTICGTVLRDCNADGNLTGEEGLAGFTVNIRNSSGAIVKTLMTDADGDYCSSNLVIGTYTVEVVPPAGYCQTYDLDGTNNNKTIVVLSSCGVNRTGVNFGYTGTNASVYLEKTGPTCAKVGDTITYKFAVTNTGNTCLYGGMSIDDPMLGGEIWHQTPVVPGEGFLITKTYIIKSTDPKTLCNTATAIGHPPFGLPVVTYQDSWTVTITNSSLPKPPCPVVQGTNCQVKLTCSGIPGWSSFKVKRSCSPGGTYTCIKSGLTSTNYIDTACTNGTIYYYVVSCIVNGVESPDSDEVCTIPTAGLPSPWQTKDIGAVGLVGGASYDSVTHKFSLVGSGADIWGTADEFRYVYQPASGSCTIVARVTSVGNSDPWAKAGIMVRETLTAGSEQASMFVTPGNGVSGQYRATTGGSSSSSTVAGLSAPYWVKLVRDSSNNFSGYYSSNGTTWTLMGTTSIPMASSVYIGLAVTSHNDGTPCAATFDNVTVTP